MKPFLSENFLLHTHTAKQLYHHFAKDMPIFDYHCHLPVKEIAENRKFNNLTQIWLNGDHYKWRAMRANGIEEKYITGKASDTEKFSAWAATVPKTLRNPLYHWTHLELKNHFQITDKLLNPGTAEKIYDHANKMLQKDEFNTRGILSQMNVKVICTTDDPTDSLEHHVKIAEDRGFSIKILPTFRPDNAMAVEFPTEFINWVNKLETCTDVHISDYQSFMDALQKRHDYFHNIGCRISDHGIERPHAEKYIQQDICRIFDKVRQGNNLSLDDIVQFKSAMLIEFARMNAKKNWTQQFHMGAIRNTNTRAFRLLGPDTGYDSIGDFEIAKPLANFLDNLEKDGLLAKTILYNLNPRDNELFAAMAGNFQDGSIPGKIQFGSGWWFNDQKTGIKRHIDALSNMGLLSRFVGMLTDSRSFLSYPRHEYFRRILCNLLGHDVENGELPDDINMIGTMVRDICYENAVKYFNIGMT